MIVGGDEFNGYVTAVHHRNLEEASNISIDGRPAHYEIHESLQYAIQGDQFQSLFTVYGFVDFIVTIDICQTLVQFETSIALPNPGTGSPPITNTAIGQSYNAVPFANWSKYKDPIAAIDALDKLVDFIRIKEL